MPGIPSRSRCSLPRQGRRYNAHDHSAPRCGGRRTGSARPPRGRYARAGRVRGVAAALSRPDRAGAGRLFRDCPAFRRLAGQPCGPAPAGRARAAGGIGLCGRSLGGALALAIALEAGDVAALALRSAFLPPEIAGRALVLPPILAQHGSRDVLVPASHAARIAEGVATAGGSCRLALYPDQAHAFDARTDAAATAQAVAFLREHLRG
ncbi:alpha/beta hydrolase family protein [Methylobacterium durans]|uniref:Dienelactone hydrolase domain-containing protein n=1 Tax=Methylobacterium durans TaxID=2202825 RepID=A0A2U8W050_9HYPH|nr:dienelactone hydrolase family protein [Methylobacterium durans]AWN39427.1 hypothetical protein DK389_01280 [Methylobacterium durans]